MEAVRLLLIANGWGRRDPVAEKFSVLVSRSQIVAVAVDGDKRLGVVTASQVVTGPRVPEHAEVTDIVAIQRGSVDANRVILISAHLDSRVSDIMNFTSDAPGANDDGSGVAAVIEAARVLSKHRFPGTIVYATLMGEEQGLYGGKTLADYAKAQGWNVVTVLNNDIIGNSCGSDGVCDSTHARVLSE